MIWIPFRVCEWECTKPADRREISKCSHYLRSIYGSRLNQCQPNRRHTFAATSSLSSPPRPLPPCSLRLLPGRAISVVFLFGGAIFSVHRLTTSSPRTAAPRTVAAAYRPLCLPIHPGPHGYLGHVISIVRVCRAGPHDVTSHSSLISL